LEKNNKPDSLFEKIESEENLEQNELIRLLSLTDQRDLTRLYRLADQVRQKYVGEEIHLRGLIEFSNYCRKNCNYCGIRRDNRKITRYRMTMEEIYTAVREAASVGFRTVVLQSGEDLFYTGEFFAELLHRIKTEADVAVTLSVGERTRQEYQQMFQAGADRYLLRFETSNHVLFKELHPDSNYRERMNALTWLEEVGFQVGSGVMIGLPGQTIADLAADILKFKDLALDMIGVGPFISHRDTPLADLPSGTVEMTYKVIAVTRIVTKDTHIPATTALGSLGPVDGRLKAMKLGANVVMPNVTPAKYRALYELYPDKICLQEETAYYRDGLTGWLAALGRPVASGYGHGKKGKGRHRDG